MCSSINLFYKSICCCKNCGVILIYDSSIRDQNGKYILRDLEQKRHFCSDADKIEHETIVIQNLLQSIDHINETELTSFKIRLEIVDG
jgi:hypothetical protein